MRKSLNDYVGKSLRAFLAAAVMLMGTTLAYAQSGTRVSGSVTDKNGEPIEGVAIQVQNENSHAITDGNGKYTLNVSDSKKAVLDFFYLGMQQQTVELNGKTQLNVTMLESNQYLDDVVVIGYGSALRKDLTGSVSTVDVEELKSRPVTTFDEALLGKAAGVQVTKNDGAPGGGFRIRVRGGSSLQRGVDPLYIIDGIPTEVHNQYIAGGADLFYMFSGGVDASATSEAYTRTLNALAGLNPNDIESITILKDASATAIYGSKAANGVVVITTKRGAANSKPKIDFNYSYGYNVASPQEVLTGDEWIKAFTQACENDLKILEKNKYALSESSFNRQTKKLNDLMAELAEVKSANTDWLDLLLRNSATHNADVSISGGNDVSRYYTSLSYTNQEGTVMNTGFERYAGKIRLDNNLSKKVRTNININFNYTNNDVTNGSYGQALAAPSILPAYNEDGTLADYSDASKYSFGKYFAKAYEGYLNPLAVAQAVNNAKTYGFKGSMGLEWDVLDELVFRTTGSFDYSNYNQLNYIPSYLQLGNASNGSRENHKGSGTEAQSITTGIFWENTLSYNKIFNGIHHIDAVIGHAWESRRASFFSASGTGYPDDTTLTGLSSAMTATRVSGANPSISNALLSFYGRVNYTLMDKYLFTFTGRSDTSSKFSKAHRTGYFPSGAIAWRISEEGFLKDVKWIDEIKFRASIGKTGTQDISDYMYMTLFACDSYADASALYASQLGNDDIKWESTKQKDLGIDFSFLNGRLGGTFGGYWKNTDGALFNVVAAPSSGFPGYISNFAELSNKGLELELFADPIRTKNFTWHVGFNVSRNISCVEKIAGEIDVYEAGTDVLVQGMPLGVLYAYKADGIIETEEELEEYKQQFYAIKGIENYWSSDYPCLAVGDPKFALNERARDYRDVIGDINPDFYGGFNTQLNYKNWFMNASFTYAYGNQLLYVRDKDDMSFGYSSNGQFANRSPQALNPDEGRANVHANPSHRLMLSSVNMYDASYLRMNSLSIGCNIPAKFLQKANMTSGSIYLSGSNLFTLTKYPGADPAICNDPYSISGGGLDVSSYPYSRTYSLGVRFGF